MSFKNYYSNLLYKINFIMKNKFFFSLIIFFLSLSVNAQKIVEGYVMNSKQEPLYHTYIFYEEYVTVTDYMGNFKIIVDEMTDTLFISSFGYADDTILIADLQDFYQITLKNEKEVKHSDSNYKNPTKSRMIMSNQFLNTDFLLVKFDDFYEEFDTLTNYLNLMCFNTGIFYEYKINRFCLDEMFAIYNFNYSSNDTLNVNTNYTFFDTNIGFSIFNIRSFSLIPSVSARYSRYRIIISEIDKMTINNYFTDYKADLRFNQFLVIPKLTIQFNICEKKSGMCYAVGIYGGMVYKIHQKPIIGAQGSTKIVNDKKLIYNYNFGVYFAYILN